MNNELRHFGILGQHWGRRNGPPYPLSSAKSASIKKKGKAEKKKEAAKKDDSKEKTSTPRGYKKLSDDELRAKINRLQLEKQYQQLTTKEQVKKENKAKKFIEDVVTNSAKNIGTQLVTYAMGTAVNNIAGKEIVNPKKGQKDK